MSFLNKWVGALLIVFTYLILKFSSSVFVEQQYSNGFFFWFRNFYNKSIGKFDFPISFIFLTIAFAILFWIFFAFLRNRKHKVKFLYSITNFLGVLFFIFYLVWGFNYGRPTLESKLLTEDVKMLSFEEIKNEISSTASKAMQLRRNIIADDLAFSIKVDDINVGKEVRESLGFEIPSHASLISNVPVRPLPDGLLMRCGLVGQYFPFTGEANFDVGMHDIRKPVVIAHEIFHAMGHGLESDCDFMAYYYMQKSNSVYCRFSAEMEYLRYLMSDLKQMDSTFFNLNYAQIIPAPLQNDFKEMKENRLKYEGFFSRLGDKANNFFLKFQGVKDGVQSYNKLVPMVHSWKKRANDEQLESIIFNSNN